MTEPSTLLSKPLILGRKLPDLCAAIASVLANLDVNSKRHKSGLMHIMCKALPQRSIVRAVDRSSAVHLQNLNVQRCLKNLILDMLPNHDFSNVAPGPETARWLAQHFKLALLSVRRFFMITFENVPGLRYLASLFIDVSQFVNDVQKSLSNITMQPTISITPLLSGWSLLHFARIALDMLQPLTHKFFEPTEMLQYLHIAFSQNKCLWQVASELKISSTVIAAMQEARVARRRLRKTRLRESLRLCTARDVHALKLCLTAFLRSRRYTLFSLPSALYNVQPGTTHTFFCCTVCNTIRSTVGGQGVKGATRCLYDFETGDLSCGKRGATQEACSTTPLLQVPLQTGVLHISGGQGAFARCPLCDCFFRYDLRAWSKGIFKCSACHYTIVDDCQLQDACATCGAVYTQPPFATRVGCVWVLRRKCANGCREPAICAAQSQSR